MSIDINKLVEKKSMKMTEKDVDIVVKNYVHKVIQLERENKNDTEK